MYNDPLCQNEIDEILKRIESTHKSVVGVLVCNQDGVIIKSTFNESNLGANSMPNTILQIVDKAKDALKDNDELTFVKMKTKKTEFIVVPGEQ